MSSIVSAEARVLFVSKTITKEGYSRRKEIFVMTSDKIVYRITLWPPFDTFEFKINDWIHFERLILVQYIGSTLSTKGFSKINNLGQRTIDEIQFGKSNIGGFPFSNIETLRTNVDTGTVYAFLKGTLISFDRDFIYIACSICQKKVSARNECNCKGNSKVSAVKMEIFVLFGSSATKVSFFSDSLSSLLGFNVLENLDSEKIQAKILRLLSQLTEKTIVMKIKAEQVSFISEEVKQINYVRFTALAPTFGLID